jgi:ubiquinone/menaquinone biosynthesis C-methylase UbiE
MGVGSHLGIQLRDYDARILTFIPHYDAMLAAAAAALVPLVRRAPRVVDLGIGSGALSERVAAALSHPRIVGIDEDEGMLALARRRLGAAVRLFHGDFQRTALPVCDAITASFALHHVPTHRRKARLYSRCHAALRSRGTLVTADCFPASDSRLRKAGRQRWLEHLERSYARAEADRLLRAWAHEDHYFVLDDELRLLRNAGFAAEVVWRHDAFAVLAASKG